MPLITPATQITNVLAALREELARKPYDGQKHQLGLILTQLEELWLAYQAGTLPPITHDGPF